MTRSKSILKALINQDFLALSTYVHPDKGAIFSPYTYITKDVHSFSPPQVKALLNDSTIYTWGYYAGSGEEISLRAKPFLDEFFHEKILLSKQAIYNNPTQRGNKVNNIKNAFTNSIIVEYHFTGAEENNNMDWRSVILVFEQWKKDEWKIVAIINDQWTI
ncbi:hypothetical protein [Rossellomorea aquimaris]|uniref:hypothetical protein n=1 Tax=Rossellomorea aquimaris TaxID=189382 RepID=UPI0007D09320|nr:hypothetical protein [Rossellomorea aquimaris]